MDKIHAFLEFLENKIGAPYGSLSDAFTDDGNGIAQEVLDAIAAVGERSIVEFFAEQEPLDAYGVVIHFLNCSTRNGTLEATAVLPRAVIESARTLHMTYIIEEQDASTASSSSLTEREEYVSEDAKKKCLLEQALQQSTVSCSQNNYVE
mmetsp:Transcript_13593/g.22999  ORF Transcript_13593/g.22999 Transcript_13593/m.22999 type:complete len:150 (-) Transcript_13593:141-590(-)|eukprot:CAMPEP_0198225240 /NCGR_PEP_ID=MMETSP1445-20131203/100324_1 /TAXON_ID=36898 /ORGANISM="Pyramimonas sp., Strain CCMP2087" /LENGTH=149 /DNA_ID=CAMNT_0043904695 /DNA_START=152 /DNA_END=601 /DNA_ORIENTATION=+